jgi:YfiR/HmsC-like
MRAIRHYQIASSRWGKLAMFGAKTVLRMASTPPHARQEKKPKPPGLLHSALRALFALLSLIGCASAAVADNEAEYRIKADFLVNFAAFTKWPTEMGNTLNLCVYGPDPFGAELDKFRGRTIAGRSIEVLRVNSVAKMDSCQLVFITRPAISNLLRVLDNLGGKPVLTVADSPGAMLQGTMLNMGTKQGRVTFEANLAAARGNGLSFSSKLLNLASEVRQ